MTQIRYFGMEACRKYGFPYIYLELTDTESAPQYEAEPQGMAEIGKVLSFVQHDSYYPTFEDKCAYLICSIAGSQYFSNGNKRLSVTILLMFLLMNNVQTLNNVKMLQELLHASFPRHVWEENPSVRHPHSLFLYNLAIVLGDSTKWDFEDFAEARKRTADMFTVVHHRKE